MSIRTGYLGPMYAVVAATCVLAAAPAVGQPVQKAQVDPAAVAAVTKMGDHLRSLQTFQVTSDVTLSAIENGKPSQTAMTATYKVRRPDGFVIDTVSDKKARRFIYDGKSFTVFAPKVGYFASVSAPATISQTVEAVYQTYGIAPPLADLFYWGESASPAEGATSARKVGTDKIGGVAADHYAFGNGEIDWEIWIQHGAQPLPRRVRITTLGDPAKPTYDARLMWNTLPRFAADTFTFTPAKDAKPIAMAKVSP